MGIYFMYAYHFVPFGDSLTRHPQSTSQKINETCYVLPNDVGEIIQVYKGIMDIWQKKYKTVIFYT